MTIEALKGVPVLVTGGCGFIGGHLIDRLQEIGAEVTVLDKSNCLVAKSADGIRLVACDLRDEMTVNRTVCGKKYVFHLAANAEVPYSVQHPKETHEINVLGTLNVALACADYQVRMVFSSSCSVYGDRDCGGDATKEWDWKEPLSPYALQKLTGEGYVRILGNLHGLVGTSLRYFNVYGPRQRPDSSYAGVVAKFCRAALRGEDVTIYGDGQQSRDFVYVEDVVQANLLAATCDAATGKIFNVGTGTRTSVNQLVVALSEITGNDIRIVRKEARGGDVRHSCADPKFATERLGFTAANDLTTGLAKTLASMK